MEAQTPVYNVLDPSSLEHRGEPLIAHGTMLRIHQHPVVAAMRELFGNRRTVRIQKQAELWRTRAQFILELNSGRHVSHKLFSLCFGGFATLCGGTLRKSHGFIHPRR